MDFASARRLESRMNDLEMKVERLMRDAHKPTSMPAKLAMAAIVSVRPAELEVILEKVGIGKRDRWTTCRDYTLIAQQVDVELAKMKDGDGT